LSGALVCSYHKREAGHPEKSLKPGPAENRIQIFDDKMIRCAKKHKKKQALLKSPMVIYSSKYIKSLDMEECGVWSSRCHPELYASLPTRYVIEH
jgi:hypothetical protein